ncbi:hypothetical protein RZS08_50690, partial [Arthrospira platensis SPKY1]|nr:hypothetical protein [Arthrospira platensis SPKY1]
ATTAGQASSSARPKPDPDPSARQGEAGAAGPVPAAVVPEPSSAAATAGEADVTGRLIPEDAVPEFVRKARRQAFWRRPLVRSMLSLCGLVLTAVLLAQVA